MKTIPMSEIIDFYKRNNPDGHWFDRGTMRFFKTKLPRNGFDGNAGVLFITRETNPSGVTRFSVRRQMYDGRIDTVGEFHSFLTYGDAKDEVVRLMKA